MNDYTDIVFWAVAPGATAADIDEAIQSLVGDPRAVGIVSALRELHDLPSPVYRRAVYEAARAAEKAAEAAAAERLAAWIRADEEATRRPRTGWRGLRRRVRSAWRTLRWRLWALRNERHALVEEEAS